MLESNRFPDGSTLEHEFLAFTLSPAQVLISFKDSIVPKIPSVSFSPESGGSVNPRRAMEEMSTQGTIRLKK